VGGDEFASSIKRFVPAGSAFRGFPILFNHVSPGRMLASLLRNAAARDILEAPADRSTAFAARCRVFVYPEDTTAAWVMLAVSQTLLPMAEAPMAVRL